MHENEEGEGLNSRESGEILIPEVSKTELHFGLVDEDMGDIAILSIRKSDG
jgi:hypothetical protein